MPKYHNGLTKFDGSKGDWGGAVTGAIGFTGSTINAFSGVKSQQDMMAEAGTSVGQGSGFTYTKQNQIDVAAQRSELSAQNTQNTLAAVGTGAQLGGSIGMAFGPIGAGIGAAAGGLIGGVAGIFGGSSRKRRLERKMRAAQERIQNVNNYNLASAQSNYLQNQYNLEHGDMQDQELFVANKGKDLVRPKTRRK